MFYKLKGLTIAKEAEKAFQSLIGVLQTIQSSKDELYEIVFQSLIGVLQTLLQCSICYRVYLRFQSLIGVLQTLLKEKMNYT